MNLELHQAIVALDRHVKHLKAAAESDNFQEVFARSTAVQKYSRVIEGVSDRMLLEEDGQTGMELIEPKDVLVEEY